ncbi:3-oxoacyl-[acyl-carrier-protein] synthase 3 protein 2 [Fulvitalea axinellae]|uniref:Beta-ketoacyl-[acyl-carrier-protein] synthase III n=1 Tax=Fulvitalea axinellae TaxID=1182444 RepID=A0AAU9CER1_9BACT|nr:3-oxoacyl-[acyl-carrier-protein] synthase 3 protein 2 [Fulvitalea axinellae]
MNAGISALSAFAPDKILSNSDLETTIETSDEWIRKRTGIQERRISDENQFTSDLCVSAAKKMAEESGISLSDVDFVIVGTITPDQVMPSVASKVQHALGANHAGTMDLTAACAGFGYGLIIAKALIESGMYKKILVFGAETLSKAVDYSDRTTCILFGDGAGVALVEPEGKSKILTTTTGTNGSEGHNLTLSNLGDKVNGVDIITDRNIHQDGRKVFKWAVETISKVAKETMENAGLTIDDIDWFIPHSANLRIIEAICKNTGIPAEKTLESLVNFGNTSSASIPLALNQGIEKGKVKKGDKLLLIGFGGGLTYAGLIVDWNG